MRKEHPDDQNREGARQNAQIEQMMGNHREDEETQTRTQKATCEPDTLGRLHEEWAGGDNDEMLQEVHRSREEPGGNKRNTDDEEKDKITKTSRHFRRINKPHPSK